MSDILHHCSIKELKNAFEKLCKYNRVALAYQLAEKGVWTPSIIHTMHTCIFSKGNKNKTVGYVRQLN